MPVLVSSKFDEIPITIESASLETAFSHYKSVGIYKTHMGTNVIYGAPTTVKLKGLR